MDKTQQANLIFTEEEWKYLVNELSLSPRQSEVVSCLLSGNSDKQIARKLKISLPTVRTHMTRLFLKYNVQDRSELILYVFGEFRKNCDSNHNFQ